MIEDLDLKKNSPKKRHRTDDFQLSPEFFDKILTHTPNATDGEKYFFYEDGKVYCRVCKDKCDRRGNTGGYSSIGALPECAAHLNQHLVRSNLHKDFLPKFESEYFVYAYFVVFVFIFF
jgi:hypothetical protein